MSTTNSDIGYSCNLVGREEGISVKGGIKPTHIRGNNSVRKFTQSQYTRAMGHFSDLRYDLILTEWGG